MFSRFALRATAATRLASKPAPNYGPARRIHGLSRSRPRARPRAFTATPRLHLTRSLASKTKSAVDDGGGQKKGPISWLGVGLLALVGGAVVAFYQYEKERRQTAASTKVEEYGTPSIGGPWELVDTEGKVVTSEDFKGRYMLIYFGFTFCPDICPNELVKIGKIVDALSTDKVSEGKLSPVIISIDPRRDTVGQLAFYSKDFHPSITWLTGTVGQAMLQCRRKLHCFVETKSCD